MAKYKRSDYEVFRRRCVELDQAGWKHGAIAQALGLTPSWVSQILKKYQEQGIKALHMAYTHWSPARLTADQLAQLVTP